MLCLQATKQIRVFFTLHFILNYFWIGVLSRLFVFFLLFCFCFTFKFGSVPNVLTHKKTHKNYFQKMYVNGQWLSCYRIECVSCPIFYMKFLFFLAGGLCVTCGFINVGLKQFCGSWHYYRFYWMVAYLQTFLWTRIVVTIQMAHSQRANALLITCLQWGRTLLPPCWGALSAPQQAQPWP